MADFPALPLWTDAYLADTRHLTTREHGAYLLLLMEAWRRPSCSVPDNDDLLARLTGLSGNEWVEVKPIVLAFWKHDKRRKEFVQKRLKKEKEYVTKQSQLQRNRIAKRWKQTKKGYTEGDTGAIPDANRTDTPTPTPIITPLPPRSGGLDEDRREGDAPSTPRASGTNPRAKAKAEAEARRPKAPEVLPARVDLNGSADRWAEACAHVRAAIGPAKWDSWFREAELVSTDPPVLAFPSPFRRDHVETHFDQHWRKAWPGIRFTVAPPGGNSHTPKPE